MKVAVQGCCHGSLNAIYSSIAEFQRVKQTTVDLLLLCGDFQALRNSHDFDSLAVPQKYHALGTFHNYYSGAAVAPVLTIVIGGNHEASNYMWELYHGGWLAPNIYYLGAAGSVMVNGLRIAGASGIYKSHDYHKGHFENVPFDRSTLRSVYHIREYDVAKLMQLSPTEDPTAFLSHDWPISIAHHGDTQTLLRKKPFFKAEVHNNSLGSPPLLSIMKHLQPNWWFSAHLHVKFAAVFRHEQSNVKPAAVASSSAAAVTASAAAANPDEISISDSEDEAPNSTTEAAQQVVGSDEMNDVEATLSPAAADANPDEIMISDDDDTLVAGFTAQPVAARPAPAPAPQTKTTTTSPQNGGARETRFLALDKCGTRREFIQFLDFPAPNPTPPGQPPRLTFDPEWLAITRALHPYLSTQVHQPRLPDEHILAALVEDERVRIAEEGVLVPAQLPEGSDMTAPPPLVWEKGPVDVGRVQQFWPTAPPEGHPGQRRGVWYTNPQTEAFCGMLGIENKVNPRP